MVAVVCVVAIRIVYFAILFPILGFNISAPHKQFWQIHDRQVQSTLSIPPTCATCNTYFAHSQSFRYNVFQWWLARYTILINIVKSHPWVQVEQATPSNPMNAWPSGSSSPLSATVYQHQPGANLFKRFDPAIRRPPKNVSVSQQVG